MADTGKTRITDVCRMMSAAWRLFVQLIDGFHYWETSVAGSIYHKVFYKVSGKRVRSNYIIAWLHKVSTQKMTRYYFGNILDIR